MRFLLAPDKFKDAITAMEGCEAMEAGILLQDPEAEVVHLPMADGGEGTMRVLTHNAGGQYHPCQVHDPHDRLIDTRIGLSPSGKTAFLEMAGASGLHLLTPEERNCYETSSYGTGELILEALDQGVEQIILGVGGSATCDGGMGMAAALGYRFYDKDGNLLPAEGKYLQAITRIDGELVPFAVKDLDIRIACDVNNFLTGPQGAAQVFGPQKGASEAEVKALEDGLRNLAGIWHQQFGIDVRNLPGAGAAGGLGAGARVFLGASLRPGIDLVMDQVGFRTYCQQADVVLTGEGKLDNQSIHGKVIQGVSSEAAANAVPVIGLCGSLEASPEIIRSLGLSYATSIIRKPCSLATALAETHENLKDATFQIAGLLDRQIQ